MKPFQRYTAYGLEVLDHHCEYTYTCETEKRALDLARKLNEWHNENS